jgi:cystathionine gamma-lyase
MKPAMTPEARLAHALHHDTKTLPPGSAFSPPIVNASMFVLPGDPSGEFQYGRFANPTWSALESALATLEAAPAIAFPSGMAAVAAVLYALARPGDRVLLPADGYHATRAVAERFVAPLGVAIETCATAALATRDFTGQRIVWIETPSNPGLALADIAECAARAHAAGALVVVDNTTAGPLGQRPLELGADVLVSSDTKIVNGHSDVVFGHVATHDEAVFAALRDWRKLAGAIPGAFEAWLVHRGLETLELRWARMCANAQLVAERLATHSAVQAVVYPGLASHPQHALAQRQMRSGGFLIGLTLASREAAERFIRACAFLREGTSFGGVHSSAECRVRWGDAVAPGYIRLSVGCEPGELLWAEIERALAI